MMACACIKTVFFYRVRFRFFRNFANFFDFVARSRKRERPKKRFLDVVKEAMGKAVVQGKRTLKTGRCGETV